MENHFKAYFQGDNSASQSIIRNTVIPSSHGGTILKVGDYIENVTINVYKDNDEIKTVLEVYNPVKKYAGDYGDGPSECILQIFQNEDGVYQNGPNGNPIKADIYTVDDFIEKYAE